MNAQHVNNIFKKLPTVGGFNSNRRARIICKDGFSVSVQASQYHYCAPRTANAEYYDAFELGYPSEPLPELAEWSEESDCTGVFGYVPAEEIARLLEAHGGTDFPAIMASARAK